MNLYESVTSNLKEAENQILEKGTRGDEPIVLVYREGAVQPYVVGINYYEDSNSWGYGYYFDNKEDAKKAFDFVCSGGNMHDFKLDDSEDMSECSVKKEGEYEEIYGEPADYTEMRADITALRSICEKAQADGFNFADKFEQAINTLSDVCADLEDFYESTSKED